MTAHSEFLEVIDLSNVYDVGLPAEGIDKPKRFTNGQYHTNNTSFDHFNPGLAIAITKAKNGLSVAKPS